MLSNLLRFLIKLVFVVSAAIVGLGLLAVAMIVLIFSVLTALVTGKRPTASLVLRRFQNLQPNGPWPGASPRSNATATSPSSGQVVDVEVREVREDRDDKRLL